MTKIKDLHKKWLRDDNYRREYAALEEEFASLKRRAVRRIEGLDDTTIEAIAKTDVQGDFEPPRQDDSSLNVDRQLLVDRLKQTT